MACTEVIALLTKSQDAAYEALRELKRLNREGWIEMTCHVLLDGGAKSGVRVPETSEKSGDDRTGGCGGTDRCSDRVLLRSRRRTSGLRPKPAPDGELEHGVPGEPPAGNGGQRYAERVAEEFETRGLTVRRQMPGDQCEVALRASIEAIKRKIAWLQELLEHESEKAGWTSGAEKERLESAIRAGRAELAAEQEQLQARLVALRAELETRLTKLRGEPKRKGPVRRCALCRGIMEAEREIADINEDLALCILDHLDGLATRASELREGAARASVETAAAMRISSTSSKSRCASIAPT